MKLFFCTLLLSMAAVVNAQFLSLSGIAPSGGGGLSSFDYGKQIDSVDNFGESSSPGLAGGLRFDFDILQVEQLKFSPEVFINQQGNNEFYTDVNVLAEDLIKRTVNLDYIGVYVPLTFYLPMGHSQYGDVSEFTYNGIIAQALFYADYVVNANFNERAPGLSSSEAIVFNKPGDKLDYGYSFKVGIINMGWQFMFGYSAGIKNIRFDNSLGFQANEEDYLVNNNGFTLTAGRVIKTNTKQYKERKRLGGQRIYLNECECDCD